MKGADSLRLDFLEFLFGRGAVSVSTAVEAVDGVCDGWTLMTIGLDTCAIGILSPGLVVDAGREEHQEYGLRIDSDGRSFTRSDPPPQNRNTKS